jgi:methionyl-tRNA synthetase
VLNILSNIVRLLGVLAEPYMPSFSAKLYEIMNVKYNEENAILLNKIVKSNEGSLEISQENILSLVKEGDQFNEPQPLFRKSI